MTCRSDLPTAKINKHGLLSIYRSSWKQMLCPYNLAKTSEMNGQVCFNDASCGDWCPHFDNSVVLTGRDGNVARVVPLKNTIKICHGTELVFERIIDERFESE
jgi:hypothetical protein